MDKPWTHHGQNHGQTTEKIWTKNWQRPTPHTGPIGSPTSHILPLQNHATGPKPIAKKNTSQESADPTRKPTCQNMNITRIVLWPLFLLSVPSFWRSMALLSVQLFVVQWPCFRSRPFAFNGFAFGPALWRPRDLFSASLLFSQSSTQIIHTNSRRKTQHENPTHGPPKIYLAQNSYPRIPEERPSTQFTPTNSRRKTKHNKSTHEFSKENLAQQSHQRVPEGRPSTQILPTNISKNNYKKLNRWDKYVYIYIYI